MNIRAVWDSNRKTMKYYFGFSDKYFIGRSWIDETGCFQMSGMLRTFVKKKLPMIMEYDKNIRELKKQIL